MKISTVRFLVSRPPVVLCLSAVLLFATCTEPYSRSTPVVTGSLAAAGFSGEAMFRGIFFLDGAVAEKIPELQNVRKAQVLRKLNANQKTAAKAIYDYVEKEIRRKKPTFFRQFKSNLESGNQLTIARALADAQEAIDEVFISLDSELSGFLNSGPKKKMQQRFGASARIGEMARNTPDPKILNRELFEIIDAVDRESRLSAGSNAGIVVDQYVVLCPHVDIACMDIAKYQAKIPALKKYKPNSLRLSGRLGASEPNQPDTDHNIAVLLLTFVAVIVIAFIALPLVSKTFDNSGLYHERLVNSLATRLKPAPTTIRNH